MISAMVGADTERLQRIASVFATNASALRSVAIRGCEAVNGIEWRGNDADSFVAIYSTRVSQETSDLADRIDGIARELVKQALAQEVASAAPPWSDPQTVGTSAATSSARLATNTGRSDSTSLDAPVVPQMEEASQLGFDYLSDWTSSESFQTILEVARTNPQRFNALLDYAVSLRQGNVFAAIPLGLESLSFDGGQAVAAAYLLYDMIQADGPWDMKPYLAEAFGQPLEDGYFYLTDAQGNRVRSDVYGNVNYGAMLALLGVDLETALAAANVGGSDTGINDDRLDDDAVRLGYELYERYPNGMTEDQYAQAIAEAGLS